MRRTKILRASRFQQNRPRRADGNVRKGRIDVVGVDKLDRLGRSFQQLAQLISEFERHSTVLDATSREIDTSESNPAGDCRCIFLLQAPNFNAMSATAFSGQFLASPSLLVASESCRVMYSPFGPVVDFYDSWQRT